MVYVTKPFCRFARYPVEGATLTRDEDVGAILASEITLTQSSVAVLLSVQVPVPVLVLILMLG